MSNSEPSDRWFRDRDIVIDAKGFIYVVIGNKHPPGEVFAYVKYVPTLKRTPWKGRRVFYERVLKTYSAGDVRRASNTYGVLRYDYVFGALMPSVNLSRIIKWLKPEERLKEIIRSPKDVVERDVVNAVDAVSRSAGISVNDMGISGSVLAGIHNSLISDINLVIYGCRNAVNVACSDLEYLGRVSKDVLTRRALRKSKIYGIPPDLIIKIYPRYELCSVNGRPVGISFVRNHQLKYGDICLKPLTPCEALIEVEGGCCSSLFYPSAARVSKVYEVIVKGGVNYSVAELRRMIKYIISFEGLFRHVLFIGGRVRVKGVIEEAVPDNYLVIIVGGAEEPGYVLPQPLPDGTSSLGRVLPP